MNLELINHIGQKESPREEAFLLSVSKIEGLIDILNKDFDYWSDFDRWQSIGVQKYIFSRAMDLYHGKYIDIRCNCCEYAQTYSKNMKNIEKIECYGVKSAYIIKKVVDEISIAKVLRANDGTYTV